MRVGYGPLKCPVGGAPAHGWRLRFADRMESRFARITAAAGRRPLLTVALVVLLSFAGALAALTGLHTSTSTDTLVDRSSSSYDATKKYRDIFGGDPVVIMAKGDLRHTIET